MYQKQMYEQAALAQAANTVYNHQATPTATAARELRIIERMNGVSSGVEELADRLESFIARLSCEGLSAQNKADQPPAGIVDLISRAENNLRRCFDLIGKLNDAF